MCLRNLDHPSFQEVKNSLIQEICGQFATDSYVKPNLRLIMRPGTIQNHHLHVNPASSASNNVPNTNAINYLSIADNNDIESTDEHVINAFSSYDHNNRNTTSNFRNNNRNSLNLKKELVSKTEMIETSSIMLIIE